MSDYNSSLPVRTENPGDVQVKVVDGTIASQTLSIDSSGRVTTKNADGAGNLLTSQVNGSQRALDVGINVAGVQIDPRLVTLQTGVNVIGSISNAAFNATQAGAATSATNPFGTRLTDGTAFYDARQIRALTSTDVVSSNIRDATGTPFSSTNPLPVALSAAPVGTAIDDYNTAPSIAANATSVHTYTVTTGKTLILKQIEATGSGKMKIEVAIETGVATNVFNTIVVQFNSTATANMSVHFDDPKQVAAGVRVRITRTNKDVQAQDLYSTIMGQEV